MTCTNQWHISKCGTPEECFHDWACSLFSPSYHHEKDIPSQIWWGMRDAWSRTMMSWFSSHTRSAASCTCEYSQDQKNQQLATKRITKMTTPRVPEHRILVVYHWGLLVFPLHKLRWKKLLTQMHYFILYTVWDILFMKSEKCLFTFFPFTAIEITKTFLNKF